MGNDTASATVLDEDRMRADLYNFIGALLARQPSDAMLGRCRELGGDATPIGSAIAALAAAARKTDAASADREYHALFIGVGRGELVPYASFYMTGFLNEKPLARLRQDMIRLGIQRAPDVCEPEDGIASLCEMMAGLITGAFGAPASLSEQRAFFNTHLAPWAETFFNDLAHAQSARLYAPLGALGAAFMQIEKEAFRMTGDAPV